MAVQQRVHRPQPGAPAVVRTVATHGRRVERTLCAGERPEASHRLRAPGPQQVRQRRSRRQVLHQDQPDLVIGCKQPGRDRQPDLGEELQRRPLG
jgi:hypothetical protein